MYSRTTIIKVQSMTLIQSDFVGQSPTGHLTEFPLGNERIQYAIAVQIAKRCAPNCDQRSGNDH
jgi:hypothetical protein